MITLYYIVLFLSFIYLLFFIYLSFGHYKHRYYNKKSTYTNFSIIVAARNEEQHIARLCEILTSQNYPIDHYEIIIVDDRSEDSTLHLLTKLTSKSNLHIFKVKDFINEKQYSNLIGKKRALQIAIDNAKYEYLAFTDADCLPSEEWLNEINKHIDDKTDFIAGYSPLIYKRPSIIDTFKSFERMSIFALTSASFGHNIPMTCTARNMVYRKSNFINAGGFSKIGHIKSGDDDLMLLLQRKLTNKHSFMFSQNSIVPSIEDKTISEHHQQEIRRASKLKYYPAYLKTIVLSVAIFYFLLLLLFLFSVLGLAKWNIFLVVFLIKTIADAALIITWQIKMKLYNNILLLPFMELFYIPYFLFYGLKGTFGAYKWKN